MRGLGEKVKQDITKLAKDISAAIKKSVDPTIMREIGQEAARLIYVRTKLGYGVSSNGGIRQKLKPLSSWYVELRKQIQKDGDLSETTRPKKSNLTLTGQLLSSISVKKSSNGNVWLGPIGYRNDGLTNEYVANKVSKERPFMFLSDLEVKKVKRFAQNNFSSVFKSRFK